jgi:tRNA-splicing ligase RtcB
MKRVSEWEILIEPEGEMLIPATIFASEKINIEEEAVSQLKNGACLPQVEKILATPDIHRGYGVPIGSVIGSSGIVSPSAVGYDINCGMRLHATPFRAADVDIAKLATSIRRDIPLGEGKSNVQLSKEELEQVLLRGVSALGDIRPNIVNKHRFWDIMYTLEVLDECSHIESSGGLPVGQIGDCVSQKAFGRGLNQLGTLGGGNHFIELQVVESIFNKELADTWGIKLGHLVFMVHSGSRGLGHQIGGEYMELAEATGNPTPDRELQYFHRESPKAERYLAAMNAAANYAFTNRAVMAVFVKHAIRQQMGKDAAFPLVYDVAHNIAKEENHNGVDIIVHRKGATRSFGPKRMMTEELLYKDTGQPVIIPGSMGTSSYLLAGVDGNEQSLCSVNHGAGRLMGRMEAGGKFDRKTGEIKREGKVTDEMFKEAMKGVILLCENERDIKSEAPQAYKDIDAVIETVVGAGLANPVAKMKPLAVLKG